MDFFFPEIFPSIYWKSRIKWILWFLKFAVLSLETANGSRGRNVVLIYRILEAVGLSVPVSERK